MLRKNKKEQIRGKQKKLFMLLATGCLGVAMLFVFLSSDDKEVSGNVQEVQIDIVSQEIDPDSVRLSLLENLNGNLQAKFESLEASLQDLRKDKKAFEEEKKGLSGQALLLQEKLTALEEQFEKSCQEEKERVQQRKDRFLKSWERPEGGKEERNVLFEIPAGTVLKAVLVSGADCSVAVQKPTGPNMVLLRPLDNGQLPRNVRVPLKGSVLLGNAIGDLSSERVYVRGERLTLVQKNGTFIETDVSAYISGEDGREGMRGVVVDRSGQIIARAAFAGFLQGIGQAIGDLGALKISNKEDAGTGDVLKYASSRGGASGLGKLSDYYIKRAEQLQPAIQIAAGRVVDIVFTKTVKIGEKNLKKKIEAERATRRERYE